MNNDSNILYHGFLSPIFILGKEWPHTVLWKGGSNWKWSLACPKGTIISCHRAQNLDTGFQIQEENHPLEIPLICFLAPLSNDFKVLCFSDKITALMAAEKVRKENYFNTFGVWVYRTLCVLISFNFQISSVCLTPMTYEGLERRMRANSWSFSSSSSPVAEANR